MNDMKTLVEIHHVALRALNTVLLFVLVPEPGIVYILAIKFSMAPIVHDRQLYSMCVVVDCKPEY